MPTCKVLLRKQQALIVERLDALRQAVQLGIDEIDAENFREFRTREEVRRHFTALTEEALANS